MVKNTRANTNTKKRIGILIVLFSTLIITLAQFIFKSGLNNMNYIFIFFGFVLYGFSFVLMIIAFQFSQLSTLYPIYATSYLWVALVSFFYFGEIISIKKIFAIFIIILGIYLVSDG